MKCEYETTGTCSYKITFDLNGDIVTNIKFFGGCPGNLLAISKLLEGKTVSYIYDTLIDNKCGMKNTSCAAELAKAVKEAYDKQNK